MALWTDISLPVTQTALTGRSAHSFLCTMTEGRRLLALPKGQRPFALETNCVIWTDGLLDVCSAGLVVYVVKRVGQQTSVF